MKLNQNKINETIADFTGEQMEKISGFALDGSLRFFETLTFVLLRRTVKNKSVEQIVHSRAPKLLNIFGETRKHATVVPFMIGRITRKSTLAGLKLGEAGIKIPGKALRMMNLFG